MTIITQPLTEKKLAKSPQAKPLVQHESGNEGDVEGSPVIVTMRARRVSTTTTLCVFFTAFLVLATGIVGGVYLYRQFTHYKVRHFRGWCGVPYVSDSKMPPVMSGSEFLRQSSNRAYGSSPEVANSIVDPVRDNNIFQERFDLDMEYEQYEEIEVPDFSHGRRGRFIHDFAANKTGIVDVEGRRCFVMPLNRSLVLPPHSLFDLIVKMRAGYYDVDTEIVRERMRVVTPPILDFRDVGYYITRECSSLPTYRLERMTVPVFKRSLGQSDRATFVEFAGNKVGEIEIVNIDEAVGATSSQA
ncbi:integral membrane protein 2B [Dermacentor variabilis]|uniref:integral membrane protein 2B n=1 Tax=Dermacentor variabilis TaxID=34621 RepID=UPI003F5B659F